jgi:hypothetical protein
LLLVPILVLCGGWLGNRFSAPASLVNPTVNLADRFLRERDTPPKLGALSPEDLSLERARQAPEELVKNAVDLRQKFSLGGSIFGAWVGLVLGAKLISLSLARKRTDFEPARGDCFACARCFEYCPNELVRRGQAPAALMQNQRALATRIDVNAAVK